MIDIDELLDLLERSGIPWPDGMSYEELASSISEGEDVSKAWGRKAVQNRRRQVRQLKAKRGKWYRR